MNYAQSLTWVQSLSRMSDIAGLEQIEKLMAALGNPQRRLRFVHISGTNGKGSAAIMTTSILNQAGYQTGTFISPFVLDFKEHFLLNGQMATEKQIATALTAVQKASATLSFTPINFVVLTAAAFLLFEAEKCDIVCLETGIGGKNDCTNIIEDTLVALIMHIGLDHTEILGNSLSKIAAEKAGILKNGCEAVLYPDQPQEALDIVLQSAAKLECNLTIPSKLDLTIYQAAPFENRINYGGYQVNIPFPGIHQAYNAAVVIEGALALWRKGYEIEDQHIISGIEKACFPARIEILRHHPLVILDGAHNTDSALALSATLAEYKITDLTLIAGMLRDKNADQILQALAPYSRALYTIAPNDPRALSANELANIAKTYITQVQPCNSIEEALTLAKKTQTKGILIVGSLHIAAEAKRLV